MSRSLPVAASQPRDVWPRATALAVAGLAAAAVMAVAGLPPIDLHGPLHHFGIMDSLCGGTRSVRLAVRGQWRATWRYNPAGVPLMLAALLLSLRAAAGCVSGRWITRRSHWTPSRRRVAWGVFAVFLAVLEVNQQAHAALLQAHQ